MTGQFYIDGIDAYSEYGAFVGNNTFARLIEYPKFKDLTSNDWAEFDGIEVDLSAPKLKSKEFDITFVSNETGFFSFMKKLTETVYHDFYFPAIDKTFKLRALKQTSNKTTGFKKFTVSFSDDYPMSGYTYETPIPISNITHYLLDDVDLSNYGIRLLNGTSDSLFFQPEIKEHVSVDLPTDKGLLYGSQKLEFVPIGDPTPATVLPANKFKQKEGFLNCIITAPNIATFWKNYNAFIYDLIQPNERVLKTDFFFEGFPFYYNGITVSDFYVLNGNVWCIFSLSLVQTNYRLSEAIKLLSTEDNYLVQTEDNIYIEL